MLVSNGLCFVCRHAVPSLHLLGRSANGTDQTMAVAGLHRHRKNVLGFVLCVPVGHRANLLPNYRYQSTKDQDGAIVAAAKKAFVYRE